MSHTSRLQVLSFIVLTSQLNHLPAQDSLKTSSDQEAKDALAEIRTSPLQLDLIHPTDLFGFDSEKGALVAKLDPEFVQLLLPTEEQKELLLEAGEKLAQSRERHKALSRKYPIESAERDSPEVSEQFSANNREFVKVCQNASTLLYTKLTEEKRLKLLGARGSICIFHPLVQSFVGIDDAHLRSMALDHKESRARLEETQEKLGDAIFFGTGSAIMSQLKRDEKCRFWWRLSEKQTQKLAELGITRPKQVAPVQWLELSSVRAGAVRVDLKSLKDSEPTSLVMVRAVVNPKAQLTEYRNAIAGTTESRDRCIPIDLSVHRRMKSASNTWSEWKRLNLEAFYKVMSQSIGVAPSELDKSLISSVLTAPLPALKGGSWKNVAGHPDASPRTGDIVVRYPDFTAKKGETYQYRIELQWALMGKEPRQLPGSAAKFWTPPSKPSKPIHVTD